MSRKVDADFVRTEGQTWSHECPRCGGDVVDVTEMGDLPFARRYACASRGCGVTLVIGQRPERTP